MTKTAIRAVFRSPAGWIVGWVILAGAGQAVWAQSDAGAHPLRRQLADIVREVSAVKGIPESVLSPDGSRVAYSVDETERGAKALFVVTLTQPSKPERVAVSGAGGEAADCRTGEPAWSPDARELAFLSDCATKGQAQLYVAAVTPSGDGTMLGAARQLTRLTGHLASPKWSPDGATIALLFVDHATRAPSPMAAGDPLTGVIDDMQQQQAQRLLLVTPKTAASPGSGAPRALSPAGLHVFEFDWSPDSRNVAYTAAPPPGDDNWYVAQLYRQELREATGRILYTPKLQMAVPRWSPDGRQIAFITGLMSDEGATGGEIYVVPSTGGEARDLTPGRSSSPSWLQWLTPAKMLFTEYKGGSVALNTLTLAGGNTHLLWEAGDSIHAGAEECGLSLVANDGGAGAVTAALVRESWTAAPEVWAGPVGKWAQVTTVNAGSKAGAGQVESVTWGSDTFRVQGWLLYPKPYDPQKKYPMLVSVHGGPAWIQTPRVAGSDFNATAFVNLGYFVFLPNPRGSFGEGEAFTAANRRDWGFGDLRDTVAGVDAVVQKVPVDPARVGMLGWSYGGSTAMMAAGRTDRFAAVVAGAGASNLQSYYGQNQIDKWMLPYFGASVYDDPAAYMHVSALTYVKQVKTPTLLLVGERDEEAPPPQSFEFWHALKELGVPTQLVVYAGEGHSFHTYEDRVDLMERAANWFATYMPEKTR